MWLAGCFVFGDGGGLSAAQVNLFESNLCEQLKELWLMVVAWARRGASGIWPARNHGPFNQLSRQAAPITTGTNVLSLKHTTNWPPDDDDHDHRDSILFPIHCSLFAIRNKNDNNVQLWLTRRAWPKSINDSNCFKVKSTTTTLIDSQFPFVVYLWRLLGSGDGGAARVWLLFLMLLVVFVGPKW